jgi:hypothetical protein
MESIMLVILAWAAVCAVVWFLVRKQTKLVKVLLLVVAVPIVGLSSIDAIKKDLDPTRPAEVAANHKADSEPAKVVMLTTTGPLPACTRPSDLGALTAIKNDRTYYRYIAEHEGCTEIPAGRTMMAQCGSNTTYRVCFIQSARGEHYMVKLIDGSYQLTE